MNTPVFYETLKIEKNAEAAARTAAGIIAERMALAANRNGRCSMALSGGSTPGRLFELLANDALFRKKMPWRRTHFFWGDERCVPPDHPDSNYRMAWDTMLSKAPVPPLNIHRVRGESANADLAAADYERTLKAFFKARPGEFPRFDLTLMGMGADGHTASLFPGTGALGERRRWVVANRVDTLDDHRITLTIPVFNHAALVVFLVTGATKAKSLQAVLGSDEPAGRLPAWSIRPLDGELLWLVDRPAAALLPNTEHGESKSHPVQVDS